ncbi:MAG: GGDEF domain-containing protein [Oleispira sp.]|nr:GGDEF domain-containing protein [Oleispira sp.]
MADINKPSACQIKLEQLEEELMILEIENYKLQQKIKHYDFDRYKLQEIQRLAKAGSWELNNLTYELHISKELSQLLGNKGENVPKISWHDFHEMFLQAKSTDIKKILTEEVIQNGSSLDFEHYITRIDGQSIYVHHHCKTFYNSIGQPLITVGMIHDRTIEHNQSIELREISLTDELTQLYNRRCINECMKEQYERFQRYGTTSSYIMLDIDYFKQINDSFGHQVGDEVLAKLAQFIKSNIRSIDFAGRWGGEEFLIICPNTILKNATLFAEKLRIGLMHLNFSTGCVITASFGVGEIRQGECTNTLIKRIDGALYQAKETGKNKLITSI